MTTPIDTMHLRTACERTAEMQESFKAADAIGCGLSVAESLMGACADLSTHVPSIIALLDEVERLRALVAHPNIVSVVDTVQHLANEVYLRGETEYAEILDTAADRLLVASGNHNTIPNADDEPEEGGDHG